MSPQNTQNAAAVRLLQTLGDVNRMQRDHAINLRRSHIATSVAASLEVVSYDAGPAIEGFVEATLENGDVLVWCLDVHCRQDCWIVEGTLDKKSGERQRTIHELPAENFTEFDQFVQALKRVALTLLQLKNDSA